MWFAALTRLMPMRSWIKLGLVVAAVGGLWLTFVLYGNSRFNAGEDKADAKWIEAGRVLEEKARASSDAATRNEAPRIRDRLGQVAQEKERIDAAVIAGTSPLDALFPLTPGVRDGDRSEGD